MSSIRTVGIIGGGVAGLAAGALLARRGVDVEIFEARDQVGDCCSTSEIDGYRFNDGALYLALPGLLDHVFAEVGLDRASVLPLRRITEPQTAVLPNGDKVTFGEGLNVTVEKRTGTVDEAVLKAELGHMMERWGPALRLLTEDVLIHPLSVPRVLTKGWRETAQVPGDGGRRVAQAVQRRLRPGGHVGRAAVHGDSAGEAADHLHPRTGDAVQ